MSFMTPISQTGGTVREVRQARIIRARLLHPNGVAEDVVIRNVSPSGLAVSKRNASYEPGERVHLLLPGDQKVSGIVRWCDSWTFGLKLDEPLDLRALGRAVQLKTYETLQTTEWTVDNRLYRSSAQIDPGRIRRV